MIGLATGSAIGWTLSDFSRRRLGEKLPAVPAVIFIMLTQTLLCLPFGGFTALANQNSKWLIFALGGITANTVANVFFVMATQRAAFTLVVPLLSLTPAFAAAIGWIVFDETLLLRQICAIFVVVVAALWLGWHGEGRKATANERAALTMMTCTSLLWAIAPFFDRACTQDQSLSLTVYVAVQCFGVALSLIGLSLFQRNFLARFSGVRTILRDEWPWVLAAATAASIGLYFQIEGINGSHVGLFEAVKRSLTLLISLLLGRFILKEKLTQPKIIAALIMTAGIFLLA